jgi:hypothetical protein
MHSLLAIVGTNFTDPLRGAAMVFAQGGSGPSPSIQWAIVGFLTILGLLVTLSPSRRTFEIKRPKDE